MRDKTYLLNEHAQLFSELSIAVWKQEYVLDAQVLTPLVHHECIIHGDADNAVDSYNRKKLVYVQQGRALWVKKDKKGCTKFLELFEFLVVNRQVSGRASGCESSGQ